MKYRIIYEYANSRFPRFFEPTNPQYAHAEDFRAALKNVREVVGPTRKADLSRETDPRIIERRRNTQYIVTIMEA